MSSRPTAPAAAPPTAPRVIPGVLAALLALVPSRIAKRFEVAPTAADAWPTSAAPGRFLVTTESGDIVNIPDDIVRSLEEASCSCLLAPRCFHLLAVLSRLPLAAASTTDEAEAAGPRLDEAAALEGAGRPAAPSDAQKEAATRARAVARGLLTGGLAHLSTARFGELLRAADEARRVSLPRLEAALLGIAEQVRGQTTKDPGFTLRGATDALGELLHVTRELLGSNEARAAAAIGTARRRFGQRAHLALSGLCTEPILAGGYAGVVSHFTDGAGFYRLADILPGEEDRAHAAHGALLRFGEISLAHAEILGASLLFASARLAPDGALGAGRDVVAVRGVDDPSHLARAFAVPWEGQLVKVLSRFGEAPSAGALLLLSGTFVDEARPCFVLLEGGALPTAPLVDHPRFAFRENLARLADSGAAARVVARATVHGGSLRILPIAVHPLPGAPRTLSRPHNLGFVRLLRGDLPAPPGGPVAVEERALLASSPSSLPSPLAALERRLQRMALGGLGTLPVAAHSLVAEEAAALRRALLPTLAALLESLAMGAARGPDSGAEAWLPALMSVREAERALAIARPFLPRL